ncbi:MAG: c-type cytochrome [Pseudomonadota bacterium]
MKSLASLLLAALLAAPVAVFAQAAPAAPAAPAPAGQPAPAPAAAAPVSAKPDLNAGSAKYAAVCASCHGADGNSAIPVNPKLAQQHPEYLLKQLQEFKAGKRPNAIMQPMASQLTDADMKNISYWAGSQKGKTGFAKDKDLVTLGERIYRGGIPDRQVAACAGCHSPNGAGVPAQFPRLSGQHADYTDAQLKAFREGQRPNSVQMKQIAARMNDREIRAVADYIAGLR